MFAPRSDSDAPDEADDFRAGEIEGVADNSEENDIREQSTLDEPSTAIETQTQSPPRGDGWPAAPTEAQIESTREPRFSAMRHRNFRVFWAGNLLSNIGTFAQQAAQGWLVRTLTVDARQAPANLAMVTACGTFPILFLTLWAGVVADRVDKRRALMVTNSIAAILAIVLALLVHFRLVEIWHVALVALCTGGVNAFDIPIRQSFNKEMVGRDDLPNAIALNSSAFNAARVAGPAVGGLLLRYFGTAAGFGFNALSFAAMLIGLSLQRIASQPKSSAPRASAANDIREGFAWVWGNQTLRLITILVGVVSLFAMSFGVLLPVFAKDVFRTDERGFALLMTCNGLGALGSAVSLALAGQMRHKGKRLLLGAFGFCLSVVAFACAPHIGWGSVWLVVAGWFLLTFLMTANTMVQTLAPDALRGRVFSIYSLALIGTTPFGALLLGALAKECGPRMAVQLCALVAAAFTFAVYVRFRSLWKEK